MPTSRYTTANTVPTASITRSRRSLQAETCGAAAATPTTVSHRPTSDRAAEAGRGIDDEEPAQADPGQERREQAGRHAGDGHRGGQQPEGHRPLRVVRDVGDHRLAGRLVDLERQPERDHRDGREPQGRRRRQGELRRAVASSPVTIAARVPHRSASQPPTSRDGIVATPKAASR